MALIVLLLIGIVFGLGFKVRILIPATFLTVVFTCLIEISHGQGSFWSALVTTAAVIAIQMGYLIGMAARDGHGQASMSGLAISFVHSRLGRYLPAILFCFPSPA